MTRYHKNVLVFYYVDNIFWDTEIVSHISFKCEYLNGLSIELLENT